MPACGAILDLPDPTIDNGSGSGDGSTTGDSQVLADGRVIGDSAVPNDGGSKKDGQVSPDDAAACGGKDCFGGPCNTGNVCGPVAIVTDEMDPKYLAYDNRTLFVTSSEATIFSIDVDDYSNRTTLTSLETNLVALTAGGGYVYFASSDMAEGAGTEHLSRCSEAACSSTRTDYATPSTNRPVGGIAFDSTRFYYSQNESTANSGGIFSCPVAGGSTCALINAVANPGELHVDTGKLYWFAGPSTTGLSSCTTTGGTVTAGNNLNVTDFMILGGEIYFSSSMKIHAVAEPGSAFDNFPLFSSSSNVIAIASDGTSVYWIDDTSGTTGTLYTCSVAACVPAPLVSGLSDPTTGGLLVTDDSIYYTTQIDSKVWRLAK